VFGTFVVDFEFWDFRNGGAVGLERGFVQKKFWIGCLESKHQHSLNHLPQCLLHVAEVVEERVAKTQEVRETLSKLLA
jgi:hypothetical protein